MECLSASTQKWLERAGWTEQRTVDTEDYMVMFAAEGYPLIPRVLEFLSRFGGLYIWHDNLYGEPDADMFHFNPYDNPSSLAMVNKYADRIGHLVCPIGEMRHGHMQLVMDGETQVYGGFGEALFLIGLSDLDAIEAICNHRVPIKQIP